MVNKHHDGGLQKKGGAKDTDSELRTDQQVSRIDLLKAIIDEWIVPVLVEAYIRVATVKNTCVAETHESKRVVNAVDHLSIPIVGCEEESQKPS
jgi:hypothetical protein